MNVYDMLIYGADLWIINLVIYLKCNELQL